MRRNRRAALTPHPVDALMNAVVDLAETTNPYAAIVFGSDPPENGICMIQNGGFAPDVHFNKGMVYDLPVLLNGKHTDQSTVLTALSNIHTALTKLTDYSALGNDAIQVVDIETDAFPAVIGREQNNQWDVGSSFRIKFYWR